MNDLLYVIRYCGNMITNTYLSFGSFRFSLLNIMVSFAAITLVGWFLRKMFTE